MHSSTTLFKPINLKPVKSSNDARAAYWIQVLADFAFQGTLSLSPQLFHAKPSRIKPSSSSQATPQMQGGKQTS